MLSIYYSFEIYCVEAYTHRVHICIFFVMEIRSRDRIYELHNEQEVLSILSRIHENEYLSTFCQCIKKKQIIGNMRYLIVFVNICFKTSTIQMALQIGIYCLIIEIIKVIFLNKQTSLNVVIIFVTVFIL